MENLIIQGILYSTGEVIRTEHVGLPMDSGSGRTAMGHVMNLSYKAAKKEILNQFNETYIGELLIQSHGNVTQAAKNCGLERQALQQIMRRYGIKADLFRK